MEHVCFQNSRGQLLRGVLHGALGHTAVVCCHGMFSTKESRKIKRLVSELERQGIASLRFDFAGRGQSDGDGFDITYSGQVQDLDAAINYLASRGVRRVAVYGSSMGGSVALLTAARDERIVGLATIAAVAYPGLLVERYPDAVQQWRTDGFLDLEGGRIGEAFLEDALSHDVVSAVGIVRAPLLVVHGTDDTVIPVADADDIAVAAQNVEMNLIEGADHQFSSPFHMRPAVDEMARFLSETLV